MSHPDSESLSLHNLTQILPNQSHPSLVSIPSQDNILSILHARHRADLNDVYIGQSTLLHINPLSPTQDLNDESSRSYLLPYLSPSGSSQPTDLPPQPPHLYDLAARAFFTMRRSGKTQAIVYRLVSSF